MSAAASNSVVPINVGIVGYGFSAKTFHIPFLQALPQLYKLQSIVQRSPTPENNASHDFPGVNVHRTVGELLADSTLDLVIITTPPSTHFSLCKEALEAKKHVLVEKPFTPTFIEAQKLVEIAKNANRILAVYQNRRWDIDFLTLVDLIDKDTLGRVVEFETHFDRHRPHVATGATSWKTQALPGGGAIYDLGVHLLDQVVHLTGRLPDRVTGLVYSQRLPPSPLEAEDAFTVLCHYDHAVCDGKMGPSLLVTAKAGVVSPEGAQLRYWVRGEKGSFRKCHLDCQEEQLKAGTRPSDTGYSIEPADRAGQLTTATDSATQTETWPNRKFETPGYVEFFTLLADAVYGKAASPVDANQAAQVIRLIQLVKLSSKEGRTLDVQAKYGGIDD